MDQALVGRAQQGDREAFALIVDASFDRCHEIARRILGESHLAQDATREAFIAAWRGLRGLRDPERFEAWSYRVLVRICYAEARKHRRYDTVPLQPTDHHVVPDSLLSLAERCWKGR